MNCSRQLTPPSFPKVPIPVAREWQRDYTPTTRTVALLLRGFASGEVVGEKTGYLSVTPDIRSQDDLKYPTCVTIREPSQQGRA